MRLFVNKYENNINNLHFFLYCFSFFMYGAFNNSIGPLIPYLSDYYQIKQTQYSIFFTVRTIACVIGAISIRFLISRMRYHTLILIGIVFIFLSSFIFFSDNLLIQSVSIGIISMMYAFIDPVLNILLLVFNQDTDKQFWVMVAHAMFGIGSLCAPLIVQIFKLKTIVALGIMNLMGFIGYLKLHSPEHNTIKEQLKRIRKVSSQLQSVSTQIKEVENLNQTKMKPLDNKLVLWMGILFFIYIGEEVTFSGWIPSYSVLTGFATLNQASMLSTLFYIFITVFRFVFLFIPDTQPIQRLKNLLISKILISLILIFFQNISPQASSYLGCAFYGITMAPLYSKYLTFPNEYGYEISGQSYATIVIIASVGQAALASVTGWLMGFTPYIFFVCLLLMQIASYIVFSVVLAVLKESNEQKTDAVQKSPKKEEKQEKEVKEENQKQAYQLKTINH